MKKQIPRILPFDNRDPDKHVLYPMPMPAGVRVIATVHGRSVDIFTAGSTQTTSSIRGFAPHIENALADLCEAMLSEPLPGVTENGKLKYASGVAFDMILHDRGEDGSADKTNAALDEWAFDDEWPVDPAATCALVLATMPVSSLNRGHDDVDLWLRRSHLMRGCMRIGMANPYANPHPILRPATLAPESWASPNMGCAGRPGRIFWQQVDNCFKRGYVGCLVVDVMQPWSVRGDHYQLITEEDFI